MSTMTENVPPPIGPLRLTFAQAAAAELMAQGFSTAQIAYRLGISPRAARGRVDEVRRKTGQICRLGAARELLRRGVAMKQEGDRA